MIYYRKKPAGIGFYTKAFDGRTLSLSAMGLYGLFICHSILTIDDILEFFKKSLEEIQLIIDELILEDFLEEVQE